MNGDSVLRIQRGLAIHGGVGTLPESEMTSELREAYETTLRASLTEGNDALERGGDAVDAVVSAVRVMEDSPLFNAGRGSNFDERGVITMDASIMRGWDRDAGAVAGVTRVRNPVELARAVMERSPHLMLIAEGADSFARDHDLVVEETSWFSTERRWRSLERTRAKANERPNVLGDPTDRAGTVGAVALDNEGRIAAATSTGGMANKTWGRVGDSPIIAAGTYAGPRCAVSCTGWGEYFIRFVSAYDVHARMAHAGVTLHEAVEGVIWQVLHRAVPRSGGLVAIDPQGNVELAFNTPGMYRGWIDEKGRAGVAIYGGKEVSP